MRRLLLAASLIASPAFAQSPAPSPVQAPPTTTPAPVPGAAAGGPGEVGAEQVVGLFMATCLQFGGNRDQLRGWLQQQGARQLPQPAQQVFLQKRPGAVYDASYQQTRLALVSLDNGACEAVAEFADQASLLSDLTQALRSAQIPASPSGADQTDPKNPAVHRRVFTIAQDAGTDAGANAGGQSAGSPHPATIIATTVARGTPQAVLTLLP